jgi:hypothetical protein
MFGFSGDISEVTISNGVATLKFGQRTDLQGVQRAIEFWTHRERTMTRDDKVAYNVSNTLVGLHALAQELL